MACRRPVRNPAAMPNAAAPMTPAELLAALRAAAEAGDVQAVAMLRTLESRQRRPFDTFPRGL